MVSEAAAKGQKLKSLGNILKTTYKKLGVKVARTAAYFILDIYPGYMMKYENKNKMTKKLQKDLKILSSADSLFVLMRYNLYVVSSIFFFNAMGAVFGNYSQFFCLFLSCRYFTTYNSNCLVLVWKF